MKRILIIMAKVPAPGAVKTRFQPVLSGEESSELARALLLDTELVASQSNCESVFACAPSDGDDELRAMLHREHRILGQKGLSLGDRMLNAFSDILDGRPACAVMIGTDCPLLSCEILEQAFCELESGKDAVLGPTADGGFYLIGLKSPDARVFANVEWSTSKTFDQTVSNIEKLGLSLSNLEELEDLDEPSQLLNLRETLQKDPAAAPNTAAWLKAKHQLLRTSL